MRSSSSVPARYGLHLFQQAQLVLTLATGICSYQLKEKQT
jgi:hypothetical protein